MSFLNSINQTKFLIKPFKPIKNYPFVTASGTTLATSLAMPAS